MNAMKRFAVFSAASALVDHLRDWYLGSDKIISMGVMSKGDYGIPEGIWTSLPVKCKDFEWEVVPDFKLSEFCKLKIADTVE